MDVQYDYSNEVKNALRMTFSDYEKELLRCCARHYSERPDQVAYTDLPQFVELGWTKVSPILDRLIQFGLIRGFSDKSIRVLPACIELVHTWDNPPICDRWDEATKWFRSKWWSLPVLILVIGLPALVTWIGMIKTVLEWMGVVPAGSHK